MTEENGILHTFSKRMIRRILGNTDQKGLSSDPWNRSSWKTCWNIWKTGRWLERAKMVPLRANHAWVIMVFSNGVTTSLETGRASNIVYLDFCRATHTVPQKILVFKLALKNCQIRTVGWSPSKYYSQCLNVQLQTSSEWCPSGLYTGTNTIKYFHQWHG